MYSFSRLPTRVEQHDLDIDLEGCFFDSNSQFKRWLPVISVESIFFLEYMINVHNNVVTHGGKTVMKFFIRRHYFLLGSPDKFIEKYIEDYVICSTKRKNTLDLE